MSAPAPVLAAMPKPTVKVRLGDAANAATCMSLIFTLSLLVFPVSFPRLIMDNWLNGRLTAIMLLFAWLFDCVLYLRIARRRWAKADPLAFLGVGVVTAVVLIGCSFMLPAAVVMTHWRDQARVREEVIALAYFALLASVFFPFLIIRFTQDRKKKTD